MPRRTGKKIKRKQKGWRKEREKGKKKRKIKERGKKIKEKDKKEKVTNMNHHLGMLAAPPVPNGYAPIS